jgi:hypothetical protein
MAVYDGHTWSIRVKADAFESMLADGRALGSFASYIEASDAIWRERVDQSPHWPGRTRAHPWVITIAPAILRGRQLAV